MQTDAVRWPRLKSRCQLSSRIFSLGTLQGYRGPNEPDLEDDPPVLFGIGQSGRSIFIALPTTTPGVECVRFHEDAVI